MPQKLLPDFEIIKLEHETYLEEYRAIKAEERLRYEARYKTSELTLIGIGLMVAASPIIYQTQSFFVYAFSTLVFHALMWTQLRHGMQTQNMDHYISHVIAPKLRKTLSRLTPDNHDAFEDLLTYEQSKGYFVRNNIFFFTPIEASGFALPLIAAFVSTLVYLISVIQTGILFRSMNLVLLVINIILFIYTVIITFIIRNKINRQKLM
jgi:hypothetical protein